MFSRSVIWLSSKTLLLPWRERPNLPCRKQDCWRKTSKLFSRGTNSKQNTSKNWEKLSVWAPRRPQCSLEERRLPGHLHARRALLFTLRAYLLGIIDYEWALAGSLRELRLDRYCRWGFRGNSCGAESDKPLADPGAFSNHCSV